MAEPSPAGRLRLCVAVVTRGRPGMLGNLVAALRCVEAPAGVDICLLIVENGPDAQVPPRLGAWRETGMLHWPTGYIHVPPAGLVHGRNAAIDHAVAAGQDLLAFIDDDELPQAGWLTALVDGMRKAKAVLAGGPVIPFVREAPEDRQARAVWNGYWRRAQRKNALAAFYRQANIANATTISTNNWLVDLCWLRASGLRFDLRYNLSGGEDTALFRETVRMGKMTAWVPEAAVLEEIPAERLTFAYQYQRARDQSMVTCRRKLEENRQVTWTTAPLSALFSLALGLILLLAAGLTLLRTLHPAARRLGAAAGRIGGLAGRSSLHYRKTGGY